MAAGAECCKGQSEVPLARWEAASAREGGSDVKLVHAQVSQGPERHSWLLAMGSPVCELRPCQAPSQVSLVPLRPLVLSCHLLLR